MRNTAKIIILFIIAIMATAYDVRSSELPFSGSDVHDASYSRLSALSDSVLTDLGNKWYSDRSTHARAFAAFSVVVNRHYNPRGNERPGIQHVVEAMRNIGVLYLVSFYKYDQAYKYLSLSRQLAEENNISHWLPYIDINLANLWEINAMIFPGSTRNGTNYVARAWENAIKDHNESLLPVIATDMAILSYARQDSSIFRSQMRYFLNLEPKERDWRHDFARTFTAGVMAWQNKDHKTAEALIIRACDTATGKPDGERYRMSAMSALVTLYIAQKLNAKAGHTLRQYSALIKSNPDFAIDLYGMYTDYFRNLRIPDSIDKYHYLYLKEKANVADERKLAHVGEKEFLDNIERINDEIGSLSEKNRMQRQQITLVSVAALSLLLISGIIMWAYRRLRSKSEQLFRKNVEMIEEQRLFSARQKELTEEVERLKAAGAEPPDSPETAADDLPETGDANVDTGAAAKKTLRLAIPDDKANEIFMRLTSIMENSREIYSPDFSLERLAQLADSKPRTVSNVINRKLATNFSQFLNEYRIREACIRFQDTDNYGNYTVEAIPESVGYRSRTGFSSLFKKATGLSPSEYQRLARRAPLR